MVGHVLRFGEILKLFLHRALVEADVLAALAVGIVVNGAAPVVAELAELLGQSHREAQSWQHKRGIVRRDGRLHFDAAIGINGVDIGVVEGELGAGCWAWGVGDEGIGGGGCRTDVESHHDGAVLAVVLHGVVRHLMLQPVESVVAPSTLSPVVIVHRSAIGVEPRSVSILKDGLSFVFQMLDATVLFVELDAKTITFNNSRQCTFFHRHFPFVPHAATSKRGSLLGGTNGQLFFSLHKSRFCPGLVFFQLEADVQQVFLVVLLGQLCHSWNADGLVRPGSHSTQFLGSRLHFAAVCRQRPTQVVVGQVVGVIVLVEDVDGGRTHIVPLHANVLIDLFHLVILRFGLHVAEDDSVHHKLAVVWRVAEIASVGQVALVVASVVVHRLVNPIPDGASAEEVGGLDGVPVVLQISDGITHRVGVFGDVEGVFDVHVAFDSLAHPVDRRILVAAHVYDVVVAFVLNGA